MRQWPTLYNIDKANRVREWTIRVEGHQIITEHGVQGGEIQESCKDARNLRYTPEEEAQALYDKQLRLKYFPSIDEALHADMTTLKPMLAHKLKEGKYEFPGYSQPKLDGIRCRAYRDKGRIVLMSRGNKEFEYMDHIKKSIEPVLPDNTVYDGELYVHGVPFNTLSSWIRGDHRADNVRVQYHIYDMPVIYGARCIPQFERTSHLMKTVGGHVAQYGGNDIVVVETKRILKYETLMSVHEYYREQGYEGSMFRAKNGLYEFGERSWNLLKIKNFVDDEFRVISISDGRGKFEGQAVFTCITREGDLFDCVIKGTEQERAQYYRDRDQYIDGMLTVKYQDLSEKGIPRFPVGLRTRKAE